MPRPTGERFGEVDCVRSPALLSRDNLSFPPPESALREPNGLLALGGDLSPARLLAAYSEGIFPWFDNESGPILWWSPDPRAVMMPQAIRISRSLRRRVSRGDLRITMDRAFRDVVAGCAAPRSGSSGTWITASMQTAYFEMHRLGYAHSVETWCDDHLVGGLYGIAVGQIFFGESMFSRASDASKVAIVRLAAQLHEWDFKLIDCQVMNPHLESLGAIAIPRSEFLAAVRANRNRSTTRGLWHFDAR
jgi:leucyl/phenylalanyl-tRNA---protein transferase